MTKRFSDWFEKVSVAAFAIGIFHGQLFLGLTVAAVALAISLMLIPNNNCSIGVIKCRILDWAPACAGATHLCV